MSATLPDLTASNPLRVHLLGVAGSGMSGLAGLLLDLGHRVSGSDRVTSLETERLQRAGLEYYLHQKAEHVHGCDLVIYSSAIKPDNVSFVEATRLGVPMLRRAEALAMVLRAKRGIIVAGTHGKTTTSSMIAHLLRVAGLNPSYYVGAEIPILGSNARWDADGELFVAEGDESDGSLTSYTPATSVLLNIEEDHLDFYKDLAAIEKVFETLLANTTGAAVYCSDDPVASRLCAERQGAVSYGSNSSADYSFARVEMRDMTSIFDLHRSGDLLGRVELGVPGRHNILNATAATAVAIESGASFDSVRHALGTFRGAKRRIEDRHRSPAFMVVDDYGHHPTEIRATLQTVRGAGRKRVLAIFQPHRYSRTVALRDAFGGAFTDADSVFLTDVYPAGETPVPGVDSEYLASSLRTAGHPDVTACPTPHAARLALGRTLREGDLVITLGAGNVHIEAGALSRDLARYEQLREAMPLGRLSLYEPLAPRTTLRVGGPAQFFAEPESEAALAGLLRASRELGLPVFFLGRGSNLLIRDGGIPGLVISFAGGVFTRVDVEGEQIFAGAGVRFKQVAAAAKTAGIGGFEWMDGIPGTVGGGLRMNAGAMGVETFDQVVSVRTMDYDGRITERTRDDLEVGYRHALGLDKEVALGALFTGAFAPEAEIAAKLGESLQKRKSSQPAASSAGCVFRNPSSIPAGKLIDELGLKNHSVGAARVSEVHGNFIVNDGGATSAEILRLIGEIREKAARERGLLLETEVRIVGEERILF